MSKELYVRCSQGVVVAFPSSDISLMIPRILRVANKLPEIAAEDKRILVGAAFDTVPGLCAVVQNHSSAPNLAERLSRDLGGLAVRVNDLDDDRLRVVLLAVVEALSSLRRMISPSS